MASTSSEPRVDSRDPASLLRAHPVLLLAGLPTDVMVRRLLHAWNPWAELPDIAEGVRWAGPFLLDAVGASEAGLPVGWSTAYAAQTARSRMRVPNGVGAEELRRRYPHGVPTGTEAVAWSLVTGLARRLDGAARLPADGKGAGGGWRGGRSGGTRRGLFSLGGLGLGSGGGRGRAANELMVLRPRRQQSTYCVYGNEALRWSALRSVLRLSLPELDRNGALAADDYCLDRPDSFEVRVEPFRDGEFLPYALRPSATADPADPADLTDPAALSGRGWPRTVYRFRCLPQSRAADAERIDVRLRAAACQLAEVVGGMAVDGEGFPVTAPVPAARR
jgi:hypothetical protein